MEFGDGSDLNNRCTTAHCFYCVSATIHPKLYAQWNEIDLKQVCNSMYTCCEMSSIVEMKTSSHPATMWVSLLD